MGGRWNGRFDIRLDGSLAGRDLGLHGHRRETLESIGREIGVTRERVRQIQIDALKNLRDMLESQGMSGDNLLD